MDSHQAAIQIAVQLLRCLLKVGKGGEETTSTVLMLLNLGKHCVSLGMITWMRKRGRSRRYCEPKGGKGRYIWGQSSHLRLSPVEFYTALTSDLLMPPTSPQALGCSSNMSFCRISQHQFQGQKVMQSHRDESRNLSGLSAGRSKVVLLLTLK